MPWTRLLMNLLLVLALVASGPLPAFAADPGAGAGADAVAAAPCHDAGAPAADAPAQDPADCCGDAPAYCACDCLHHGAAVVSWAHRAMPPPRAGRDPSFVAGAPPQVATAPETRPPIA